MSAKQWSQLAAIYFAMFGLLIIVAISLFSGVGLVSAVYRGFLALVVCWFIGSFLGFIAYYVVNGSVSVEGQNEVDSDVEEIDKDKI